MEPKIDVKVLKADQGLPNKTANSSAVSSLQICTFMYPHSKNVLNVYNNQQSKVGEASARGGRGERHQGSNATKAQPKAFENSLGTSINTARQLKILSASLEESSGGGDIARAHV